MRGSFEFFDAEHPTISNWFYVPRPALPSFARIPSFLKVWKWGGNLYKRKRSWAGARSAPALRSHTREGAGRRAPRRRAGPRHGKGGAWVAGTRFCTMSCCANCNLHRSSARIAIWLPPSNCRYPVAVSRYPSQEPRNAGHHEFSHEPPPRAARV